MDESMQERKPGLPLWRVQEDLPARDGDGAPPPPEGLATPELVARCQQGDRLAFDKLLPRIAPTVQAAVWSMSAQQGEDWRREAAAETFLQIYRTISTFRGNSTLGRWVYGVAVRTCLFKLRTDRRRQRFLEPLTEHAAVGGDPAQGIENQVLGAKIRDAAWQLPTQYRQVFALHALAGCSYREISSILDLPEGTVKSRMYEAKQRLRRMLPPRYWSDKHEG